MNITNYTVSLFINESGQWCWQAVSCEGRVLASSSTGFATRNACSEDATAKGFAIQDAEECVESSYFKL